MYAEVEAWVAKEKFGAMRYPQLAQDAAARLSEEMCTAAATISKQLEAKAIFVYTRTGRSAGFVSRRRPDCPIFAVTGAFPNVSTALMMGKGCRPKALFVAGLFKR